MIEKIRLFPSLAIAAALLGGVKVISVVEGMTDIVPVVRAADVAPAEEGHDSAATAITEVPASADVASSEDAKPAELQADGDGMYSPAELQLLQSLSARRAELDKRENDLDMREQVLKVTEKRLEEKMSEIRKVQDDVNVALKTYDNKEDAQLQSIVKVYETMKPGDAARILNTLDMPVLIQVAQRMSERKIAPIMASMDAATAKKLTMELATRKPLTVNGQQASGDSATQ
jgi:flagellar motility protein MotE (MotC chaperone)